MSAPTFIPPPMIMTSRSLISPVTGNKIFLFRSLIEIVFVRAFAVLRGSAFPQVIWQVRYDLDNYTDVGTLIVGSTTVSTTAGDDIMTITNAVVSAGAFIWLEMDSVTGTVDEFGITLHHRGA